MALKSHIIRNGLLAMTTNPPQNALDSARLYSAIYAEYAAAGRTILGNAPLSLAAAQAALTLALVPVFTGFGRPPGVVAEQMAQAFTAFWLLPPVVTAGSFPGVVTLVLGTPVLGPALQAVWAQNVSARASNQEASQRLADVLHAFTLTVTVTEATVPTPTIGTLL